MTEYQAGTGPASAKIARMHLDEENREEADATTGTGTADKEARPAGASSPVPPSSPEPPCPTAAPNAFFDGSYFSLNTEHVPHSNMSYMRHTFFEYSVPRWSYLYTSALIALDVAMTLAATGLTFLMRPRSYAAALDNALFGDGVSTLLLLIAASWIASLASCRIYSRHTMGEGYDLYSKVISAAFVDFIILCAVSYAFHFTIPRTLTFFVPALSAVLTMLERYVMRKVLHRYRRKGRCSYPTIIVGSPRGIHSTLAQLKANTDMGYEPIAVCPVVPDTQQSSSQGPQHLIPVRFDQNEDDGPLLRVLPMNSHLPQTAKYLGAQTVLVADVMDRHSETMRTLSLAVESMGIELAFTATVADVNAASLHLRDDPSMPILTARLPQYSTMTRIMKRIFDIVLAIIALIIFSPAMIIVAIRVRAEDGGPAIYTQQRIGIYGKPFTMYKFRSMRVNADEQDTQLAQKLGTDHGILFKAKDDPRITTVGKFIRKTSLDEFPQLFNVITGDMSLVGPRPQQQYEVNQYKSLYSARLLVKPGITGPWQVSGRSDLSQEASERLDVSYVEHWSLTSDMAILLKTVVAVIRGTGSY
ncbi:MAG: sugar transferase [Bifidobacterium sp.]|jgi:exopolysaccharide biosynthesis polyprenyl glycosylphosphotransferase|nr:sugar transferase [Bifidobacterium sp.]